jgi:hypothetical protein
VPATNLSAARGSIPPYEAVWIITVNVLSAELGLCGIWEGLSDLDLYADGRLLPGLVDGPARYYFDEGERLRAWLAAKVRGPNALSALRAGQELIDDIFARTGRGIANDPELQVSLVIEPAPDLSAFEVWEPPAPRSSESVTRPIPWSHYEPAADGLHLTITWSSGHAALERTNVTEEPERVTIALHERRAPLVLPDGMETGESLARSTRMVKVRLATPLGERTVFDAFDGGPGIGA